MQDIFLLYMINRYTARRIVSLLASGALVFQPWLLTTASCSFVLNTMAVDPAGNLLNRGKIGETRRALLLYQYYCRV